MILQILAATSITLAIAFLFYAIRQATRPEEELEDRIDEWIVERGPTVGRRTPRRGAFLNRFEQSIARRGFGASIKSDLARAGLPLTATEYLLIQAGVTVVSFVIGYVLRDDMLTGLLLGGLGFILPIVYVRMRQRRRLGAFNSQLPNVLDHLVGSLRAGYGLVQSLEWVGRQIPDPAGTEFERVVREVRLDLTVQEALNSMLNRVDRDELALIITAVNIQYKVGGTLADVL